VDRIFALDVGNESQTHQYDLSETVRIASTTMCIVASFKRDECEIRRVIAFEFGERRTARLVNSSTPPRRTVVETASSRRQAIVLEDILDTLSLRKGMVRGRKIVVG